MDRIINEGIADYVSLSRPLIQDPFLINKMLNEEAKESGCTSCNYCCVAANQEHGVFCVQNITK